MTGPQTEIEIRLWRDEFARMRQTPEWIDAATDDAFMDAADDLLRRYRARYGLPQHSTPPAVWYDEPPFAKDGASYPCWVDGEKHPVLVAMYSRWEYRANDDDGCWLPLNGRRVCPIVKPQEPTK
jgi:hypothetical protein